MGSTPMVIVERPNESNSNSNSNSNRVEKCSFKSKLRKKKFEALLRVYNLSAKH
jgi:hypothetical protein